MHVGYVCCGLVWVKREVEELGCDVSCFDVFLFNVKFYHMSDVSCCCESWLDALSHNAVVSGDRHGR